VHSSLIMGNKKPLVCGSCSHQWKRKTNSESCPQCGTAHVSAGRSASVATPSVDSVREAVVEAEERMAAEEAQAAAAPAPPAVAESPGTPSGDEEEAAGSAAKRKRGKRGRGEESKARKLEKRSEKRAALRASGVTQAPPGKGEGKPKVSRRQQQKKRAREAEAGEEEGGGKRAKYSVGDEPTTTAGKAALKRLGARLDEATVLVEEVGGTPWKEAMRGIADAMAKGAPLAVDCEGVRLSRTGAVTLLQLAALERVYLFDIAALGSSAFDVADDAESAEEPPSSPPSQSSTLRRALEDPACQKLMFDCRRDSDALAHQFGVRIEGVLDVQLMDVALRRKAGAAVEFLPGLVAVLRRHAGTGAEAKAEFRAAAAIKARVQEQVRAEEGQDAHTLWGIRPMNQAMRWYAALDTMAILETYHKIERIEHAADPSLRSRVLKASEARLGEYRDLEQELDQTPSASARLPPADL